MTIEQLLAIRIDWLGLILVGMCLNELLHLVWKLFKKEPPEKVTPFYRHPAQHDPGATLPLKVIRLEEIPPDEWEKNQGRFW